MDKFNSPAMLALSTPDRFTLAQEYYLLRVLPTLDDQQADRLGELLDQALDDRWLDFWITEIEHSLAHRLALLTADRRQNYEDQRSLLREHLGSDEICQFHSLLFMRHRS